MSDQKIDKLKKYFIKRDDVMMAFVFGSHAKQRAGKISDWDIACYFKSERNALEWEFEKEYPQENEIWNDLIELLETDSVDLIVLNRAPASVAYAAVLGLPLVIRDKMLYHEFLLRISQEAEDFRQTAQEYAKVYWRSKSLCREDKAILNRRIVFLDSELKDAEKFRKMSQFDYERDNMKRREVERWVENLMNAAIDVAKTLLASQKRPVPATYRQVLQNLGTLPIFSEKLGEQLADWSKLRNILAHEYLDIRWKQINDFIKRSEPYFRELIEIVKNKYLL